MFVPPLDVRRWPIRAAIVSSCRVELPTRLASKNNQKCQTCAARRCSQISSPFTPTPHRHTTTHQQEHEAERCGKEFYELPPCGGAASVSLLQAVIYLAAAVCVLTFLSHLYSVTSGLTCLQGVVGGVAEQRADTWLRGGDDFSFKPFRKQ